MALFYVLWGPSVLVLIDNAGLARAGSLYCYRRTYQKLQRHLELCANRHKTSSFHVELAGSYCANPAFKLRCCLRSAHCCIRNSQNRAGLVRNRGSNATRLRVCGLSGTLGLAHPNQSNNSKRAVSSRGGRSCS